MFSICLFWSLGYRNESNYQKFWNKYVLKFWTMAVGIKCYIFCCSWRKTCETSISVRNLMLSVDDVVAVVVVGKAFHIFIFVTELLGYPWKKWVSSSFNNGPRPSPKGVNNLPRSIKLSLQLHSYKRYLFKWRTTPISKGK